MQRYVLARILQGVFCLLVMSLVVFLLTRLTGNPVDVMLSAWATDEDRERLTRELGLDQPLLVQYGVFLSNAIKGDFGASVMSGRPALRDVLERFPATLELATVAIALSLMVALPVGVYSAVRRGSVFDGFGRGLAILGQAMPPFWLGILLIFVFAVILRWLPAQGRGSPQQLLLPAVTLGWFLAAGIMRITRSSMIDVLNSEYIKLVRIKGAPEWMVIWKHALKNAALPIMTFSMMFLIILLGGAVITETVFAWPGVGSLVVDAVRFRDFPVVQTVVVLLSALFIMGNLAVDILYAYLNPKIRYQ